MEEKRVADCLSNCPKVLNVKWTGLFYPKMYDVFALSNMLNISRVGYKANVKHREKS